MDFVDMIAALDADKVYERREEMRAAASVSSKPPKVWRIEDIGMFQIFTLAFPEHYGIEPDTKMLKVSDVPANKRKNVRSAWIRRADGSGELFQCEIAAIVNPGPRTQTGIVPA